MPPSSSGPGRSPLKAQTGVRVPLGASVSQRPPTDNVERFLSMLRFNSREKVNALGHYADLEVSKIDNERFESPFYLGNLNKKRFSLSKAP
jgi:hypothetical protein